MNQGIEQSKLLHKSSREYGNEAAYKNPKASKNLYNVDKAIKYMNKEKSIISSVLDYGTGKGGLLKVLKEELGPEIFIQGYDPAVEEYSELPKNKFHLVTCIDVLEHIDRKSIHDTLEEIKNLTGGIFFYSIDMIPARKSLEDGRNAHITLAPPDWWNQQISSVFPLNLNFQIGKLPSGELFPLRLIGCSANDIKYIENAMAFIKATDIYKRQWILNSDGISMKLE